MSQLPSTSKELAEYIRGQIHSHPFLIALDGPCGSGKTSLSEDLSSLLSCPVIHMDDFFLQPAQRTPERLSLPGENIDHERFLEEVLLPLSKGQACVLRPYDCQLQAILPGSPLPAANTYLIEGSYSLHPALSPFYNLRIFLRLSEKLQQRRLCLRETPASFLQYQTRWIPMETLYFNALHPQDTADLVLDMDAFQRAI